MAETNLHPDQESQKRRTTRIVQAVPLTVTGVDALGRPFQERTSTLIINCHGARYQSKHYVLKNMWVTLEVPHNEPGREARSVRGRVTWIQRPRTVRELFQIGVELEVSGNVWGIAFPPGDWFPFPESGAAPDLNIPVPSETLRSVPEPEDWSATEEAPVEPTPRPEPVEDNVRVLPLPATGDASLQLARQMARLVIEAKQQIQSTARESATHAVAAETRPLLAALQTQLNDAADKSVAAAVAAHLEKSQQETVQRMERERETGMAAMLQKLSGEIDLRLSDARLQMDTQLAEVERTRRAEFDQQIQNQVQAAIQKVESLSGSMGARQDEVQAVMDQVRESSAKAAAEEIRRWQEQMDLRTVDAQARLAQMDAQLAEVERTRRAEFDQQIQKQVQAAIQKVESLSGSVGARQDEVRAVMDQVRESSAKAAAEEIRRWQEQMDLRTVDAQARLAQMDAQLAEVERTRRAEFDQQIQKQVQAAIQKVESLSGSVGARQDEVRAVMDQVRESSAKAAAEEIRRWQEQMDLRTVDAQARLAQMDLAAKRLGEQIAAATAIAEVGWRGLLEADLAAASKRWQEKMEATIQETSRRASDQLSKGSEVFTRQIEQQLQQRINALGNSHLQVTSQAESALEMLRAAINKEIGKGGTVIARFQDSVSQLEAKRGEFTALLQTAPEEWARQGEALLESQSAEMNRRLESAVTAMAQRLQPMLESAGQGTIEKLASELEQRLAPQIAGAKETLGKLAFDRDHAEKAVTEHQQRIWQVSDRSLQETAARGKDLLAQIEKDFSESARAASGRWLAELETRATETSHSTFESLFKSADWYEKKFQTQMQTTMEKGIDQAVTRLREKAAEMSGVFASELDHYSRSYVEHAQGQMQENASDAAERGSRQIAEASDAAAAKFTDRAAQLGREQFDLYSSKTKTAFEQNAAYMEAHTTQVRSKLESDARGFASEFQRALSQHAQQTLALGKQELGIQIDQAKDALLIESQALERQFQSSLNSLGTYAMDEHKQRLENASNSWLLTTVTRLNQQSENLITDLASTTEKRLKAVCGNVFSEMGETLRLRLAGLTSAFGAPATPPSPAPNVDPSEKQK